MNNVRGVHVKSSAFIRPHKIVSNWLSYAFLGFFSESLRTQKSSNSDHQVSLTQLIPLRALFLSFSLENHKLDSLDGASSDDIHCIPVAPLQTSGVWGASQLQGRREGPVRRYFPNFEDPWTLLMLWYWMAGASAVHNRDMESKFNYSKKPMSSASSM